MKINSKLKNAPKGKSLTIQFTWNLADVKQALKYAKGRVDEDTPLEADILLSYIIAANRVREYGIGPEVRNHIGSWMLNLAKETGLVWDMGEYGGDPDMLVISETLEQTMKGRKGLSRPFPGNKEKK